MLILNHQVMAAAKKRVDIAVLPTPSGAPVASASPSPSPKPSNLKCGDVIDSCDKALDAKNKEIEQAGKVITQVKEDNVSLTKAVDSDKTELKNPVRNPFLMVGAGAAVGLLIGGPVTLVVGLLGGIIYTLVTQ